MTAVLNAMTVDVEDYFHVSALARSAPRAKWDSFESRVAPNTNRLLDLFDEAGVRVTCFVLGWVADRHPGIVKQIADRGHEIASHGFWHELVYDLTPAAFREDVRQSKALLEHLSGHEVVGYRAPSFTITTRSMWALDVLLEEGYRYDASIFPVHHDRYGVPDAPRHHYAIERHSGSLAELPPSTVRLAGQNFPVAGGGYFRLLPYAWTRWGIGRVNRAEQQPVIFYLHPWEVDPDQPRLPATTVSRLRHYTNLAKTEPRLRRLMHDFRWAPIRDVFPTARSAGASVVRSAGASAPAEGAGVRRAGADPVRSAGASAPAGGVDP